MKSSTEKIQLAKYIDSQGAFKAYVSNSIVRNKGLKYFTAALPIIIGVWFLLTLLFTEHFDNPGAVEMGPNAVFVFSITLVLFGLYGVLYKIPEYTSVETLSSSISPSRKRNAVIKASEKLGYEYTLVTEQVIKLEKKSSFPSRMYVYIDDESYSFYLDFYELPSQAGSWLDFSKKKDIYAAFRRYLYGG